MNQLNQATSAELVTTDKFHWSDLWKQDDWQAVWLGFTVILFGAIAVLTGAFNFSAATFSTWGNGVSPFEQFGSALLLMLL